MGEEKFVTPLSNLQTVSSEEHCWRCTMQLILQWKLSQDCRQKLRLSLPGGGGWCERATAQWRTVKIMAEEDKTQLRILISLERPETKEV